MATLQEHIDRFLGEAGGDYRVWIEIRPADGVTADEIIKRLKVGQSLSKFGYYTVDRKNDGQIMLKHKYDQNEQAAKTAKHDIEKRLKNYQPDPILMSMVRIMRD